MLLRSTYLVGLSSAVLTLPSVFVTHVPTRRSWDVDSFFRRRVSSPVILLGMDDIEGPEVLRAASRQQWHVMEYDEEMVGGRDILALLPSRYLYVVPQRLRNRGLECTTMTGPTQGPLQGEYVVTMTHPRSYL